MTSNCPKILIISKGRNVGTKARFDWINVTYSLLQPVQLFWVMLRYRLGCGLHQSGAEPGRVLALLLVHPDRHIVSQISRRVGDGR